MSRWLVVGALLGCWGCAFSLDGPDPNRPRNRVPVCDTSKGMVALDGVMAAALGVAALSFATEEPAAALIPLGLGALYLGGAVSGNRAVNKCREAIADYEGSYDEEYADEQPGRLIPRGQTSSRTRRPADPYSEQPPYPRPQPFPRKDTYTEQPAYPPPQPGRPQPPVQQPPGQQPPVQQPSAQQPVQQPPASQPRQPAPAPSAEDGGDWSDFWREVP